MALTARLSAAGLFALGLAWAAPDDRLTYPPTRRVDQVDRYHGTEVADPYRWLEADVRQSPEVAAWVEAQNRFTAHYLEAIPERAAIRRRLAELWNFERYTRPFQEGGRYFFLKNDGLQNHSVLYMADSPDGEARALLDPNRWSADGTVALNGFSVSPDGKHLAYGVAEAGSDWQTWRVLDVASGKPRADEIKWVKFGHAAWTRDGRGFFYARYDEPRAETRFQARDLNHKIYYHPIGTPPAGDALVFHRPDQPDWSYRLHATDDGKYLVIAAERGDDGRFRIFSKDLAGGDPPVELIGHFDNQHWFVDNDGPVFFFQTDLRAPRKRLIAIDTRDPRPERWREVIPQAAETLHRVARVGDRFIATYLKDARSQVKVFALDGSPRGEVSLPGVGTASGFEGGRRDADTFYTFASFATPPSIYRYDLATGRSSLFRRPKVAFDPADYQVDQVFFASKDGTRVPMFVAHKKGVKRDGANPTLLYGYGGLGVSLAPWFSVSALAWMDLGGVYAVPNLRGGGEYGEAWHLAAVGRNKQKTFDDFIAAAEWLIANRYTRPEKLAAEGGSNGGLMVGAVLTQRPDLFGACLPEMGVLDMLRFHRFTAGRLFVSEVGSPDDPDTFRALRAYSPYHNVRPGTRYPATLVTTGDTDDRVVPLHSFKFAAALQHAQAGPAPVLLRVEVRGGHGGAGKPTARRIDEVADQFAFLVRNLGMRVTAAAAAPAPVLPPR